MIGHNALAALIERLATTPVQSSEDARSTFSTLMERITDRIWAGESYGDASDGPAFLKQPYDDFRDYLKPTDNDLSVQVDTMNQWLDRWFELGETPAPYAAWRICIILRRQKETQKERAFLEAWCDHFGECRGGRRYEDLAARLAKLKVG